MFTFLRWHSVQARGSKEVGGGKMLGGAIDIFNSPGWIFEVRDYLTLRLLVPMQNNDVEVGNGDNWGMK